MEKPNILLSSIPEEGKLDCTYCGSGKHTYQKRGDCPFEEEERKSPIMENRPSRPMLKLPDPEGKKRKTGDVERCSYCNSRAHIYSKQGDCPEENLNMHRKKLSAQCCFYCCSRDHSFIAITDCPKYSGDVKDVLRMVKQDICSYCERAGHSIGTCRDRAAVLSKLGVKLELKDDLSAKKKDHKNNDKKVKQKKGTDDVKRAFEDLDAQAKAMRDVKREIIAEAKENEPSEVDKKLQKIRDELEVSDKTLAILKDHVLAQKEDAVDNLQDNMYTVVNYVSRKERLFPSRFAYPAAVCAAVGVGLLGLKVLYYAHSTSLAKHVEDIGADITTPMVRTLIPGAHVDVGPMDTGVMQLVRYTANTTDLTAIGFAGRTIYDVWTDRLLWAIRAPLFEFTICAAIAGYAITKAAASEPVVYVMDKLRELNFDPPKRHVARRLDYTILPQTVQPAPVKDLRPDVTSLSDIKHSDPLITSMNVREILINNKTRSICDWACSKAKNFINWVRDDRLNYDCVCARNHIECGCDDAYHTYEEDRGQSVHEFSHELVAHLLGGKKQDPRMTYDQMVVEFMATAGRTHTINTNRYENIDQRVVVNSVYLAVAIAQHNRREQARVGQYDARVDPLV